LCTCSASTVNRTPGLQIFSLALSQLSYRSLCGGSQKVHSCTNCRLGGIVKIPRSWSWTLDGGCASGRPFKFFKIGITHPRDMRVAMTALALIAKMVVNDHVELVFRWRCFFGKAIADISSESNIVEGISCMSNKVLLNLRVEGLLVLL
jgi:hypothetical protein